MEPLAAAIASGDDSHDWTYIESQLLPERERGGWELTVPVGLMKSGERDVVRLTDEVDPASGAMVEHLLRLVLKLEGTAARLGPGHAELPEDVSRRAGELFQGMVREGGTQPWMRSKIMLVGAGRAGKSSLMRSLLGLSFRETPSTIGADATNSCTSSRDADSGGWVQRDAATQSEFELALVAGVIRELADAARERVGTVSHIPRDFRAAIAKLRSENAEEAAERALRLIQKSARKIVDHPEDSKFRRIAVASRTFASDVAACSGGVELFCRLGFQRDGAITI